MSETTIAEREIPANFDAILERFGLELYAHQQTLREQCKEMDSQSDDLRAKIRRIDAILNVIDDGSCR